MTPCRYSFRWIILSMVLLMALLFSMVDAHGLKGAAARGNSSSHLELVSANYFVLEAEQQPHRLLFVQTINDEMGVFFHNVQIAVSFVIVLILCVLDAETCFAGAGYPPADWDAEQKNP
jgi:hypothetical protein